MTNDPLRPLEDEERAAIVARPRPTRALPILDGPHASIADAAGLDRIDPALLPGILKTARLGYDGKGQLSVRDRAELAAAFATLGEVPCVLEKRLKLAEDVLYEGAA